MHKILKALEQVRPEHDFSTSENFFTDGLLDSFDVMLLVSELDKAHRISIDGAHIVPENFESVPAIQKLLSGYGVAE